ncbi:MAG: thioredoxin family protein [Halanaerobiales bacterium]
MKKIEILGTGCPKCQESTKIIKEVIDELEVKAEIAKVEEVNEIVERGVMSTPAVAVDGEVKVAGEIPSKAKVRSWFE